MWQTFFVNQIIIYLQHLYFFSLAHSMRIFFPNFAAQILRNLTATTSTTKHEYTESEKNLVRAGAFQSAPVGVCHGRQEREM